jgi:Flp pilus assembly CpaF family ATPase
MAVRKSSDLSRMIVEAEMREIGIEKAKLHKEQIKVLEKAQDTEVNVMVLYGGTGSGKTVLAAEVVKIWMAEHLLRMAQQEAEAQMKQKVYL